MAIDIEYFQKNIQEKFMDYIRQENESIDHIRQEEGNTWEFFSDDQEIYKFALSLYTGWCRDYTEEKIKVFLEKEDNLELLMSNSFYNFYHGDRKDGNNLLENILKSKAEEN